MLKNLNYQRSFLGHFHRNPRCELEASFSLFPSSSLRPSFLSYLSFFPFSLILPPFFSSSLPASLTFLSFLPFSLFLSCVQFTSILNSYSFLEDFSTVVSSKFPNCIYTERKYSMFEINKEIGIFLPIVQVDVFKDKCVRIMLYMTS